MSVRMGCRLKETPGSTYGNKSSSLRVFGGRCQSSATISHKMDLEKHGEKNVGAFWYCTMLSIKKLLAERSLIANRALFKSGRGGL